MSPPRIARSGDAFDQLLVRAAHGENPPRGAEERALAALGLSTGAATSMKPSGTTSALQAGTALKMVGGLAALTGIAVLVGARILSPSSVGSTSAGVTPAPLHAFRATLEPTAPAAQEVPDLPVALVPAEPARLPDPARPSVTAKASPPTRALAVPLKASARDPLAAAPPSSAAAPSLSMEIALVQQATRALAGGEPGIALTVLDAYRHDCPQGVLAGEAGVLRVEALAATGATLEARALARKLLAADPHAVLAPRLRAVIGGDSPGG